MMNMILIFMIFMFMAGGWVFVLNWKHLLITLLSLEFLMLSLFLFLFLFLFMLNFEMYFLMVFLTFSVCEGALGLSILVSMIRTHGNNYFQSFSILKC
nr:NADH dehydrogenase subunit 4L [Azana sp. WQY005]